MRFSESWLRTLCDPPLSTAALCERLTMAGLEVEEVVAAAPAFSGVVVGRIEAVAPHPSADRLRVCEVDVGRDERLRIVCGAPNAVAGMKAPCALVGAKLPGGTEMRRATVRGVESQGMLCSARELGLSEDASGLLALADDAAVGADLREALGLDDAIITLKLTPNRADCLSLLGIAREVSAITGAPLRAPVIAPVAVSTSHARRVRIDDPAACPRFASRMIDGIDARAPTPSWMKQRLERCGIRSISAVVDVTNYVMLELGQPMHAYDDRLLDGDVVVRFAEPDQKLTLLNGETLELEPDLLLVCDENKPLGLAGIMGGEHSGIGEDTTSVFLEAAFWNPLVIQGKMRRLGFASDAGHRFERGVDFALAPSAIERASALILDICGGRAGPVSDVVGELPAREPVCVRASRVAKVLGVPFSIEGIADAFVRLELPFVRDDDAFVVTPPSYRFDLAIEEDFIEEVARMRGYDAIPAAPAAHVQQMLPAPEGVRSLGALKDRMVDRDYQEIVTFGFVSSEVEAALDPGGRPAVRVLNPIASQLDVMRRSLLPGLLQTLQASLNRKEPRVRLFEAGRVYRAAIADEAEQPMRIGGLAFGDALPEQWGAKPSREADFFDVKGDLEALAWPLRLSTTKTAHPALHPGRAGTVAIEGAQAGWLGELHPRLVRRFELGRAPIVFELDVAALAACGVPTGLPVSKLPVVRRDLAFVVGEDTSAAALVDTMRQAAPPFVDAIRIFDVYRGAGLTDGAKSVAILVLMQDTARTLTDADIDAAIEALVQAVAHRHGATLRTQGSR